MASCCTDPVHRPAATAGAAVGVPGRSVPCSIGSISTSASQLERPAAAGGRLSVVSAELVPRTASAAAAAVRCAGRTVASGKTEIIADTPGTRRTDPSRSDTGQRTARTSSTTLSSNDG